MASQYQAVNHSSEDISMYDLDTSYNNGAHPSTLQPGHQRAPSDFHTEDPKSRLVPQINSSASSTRGLNAASQRPRRRVFATWWKETIACFLVVAAAIAIFGTLYPYQGKPLPEWPYLITVNALLSAYMVVLKAGATFLLAEGLGQQKWRWFDERERPLYDLALHDEATRGPWGAVRLLWRLSLHHVWHWLGCILILVALFVDPFAQQVLHYRDCNVPDEAGIAAIPRSNFFAGGGLHSGGGLVSITSEEQAAINAGISAPGGQVGIQCSSGNCTFPTYNTIGYCSSTVDISNDVQFEWTNYTYVDNQTYRGLISWVDYGLWVEYVRVGQTNFSAFGDLGDNFQYIIGYPTDGGTGDDAAHPLDPVTEARPTGCDDAATNGTWRCEGYGAANISLYPCVRTYSASVVQGVLHETLLHETAKDELSFGTDIGGHYASTINASCLHSDERSFLVQQGYLINSTTDWIPYNISLRPDNETETMTPVSSNSSEVHDFEKAIQRRRCIYIVQTYFMTSITEDYLDYAWTGNLTGAWNMGSHGVALFEGPQLQQSLFNFGQYSFERTQSTFRNISDSLTNHMRMTPGLEGADTFNLSSGTQGLVYHDKTCLRVEWPWLALPGALAVLTLLFFFGVLWTRGTLSDEVRTWKSSPLPLIFHGPQRAQGDVNLQEIEAMEAIAKRMNVRLVRGQAGEMILREWGGEKGI